MSLLNETASKYSRKLSPNDLLSIAHDRVCSFNNQMVLEGEGFDKAKWLSAVEKASAANPGSRLILKGYPFASRWVDSGITPRIREVDGSKWSGCDLEGAPFLMDRLPPEGPTCEVVVAHGSPQRVILRSNHGVMDAMGTIYWVLDIFRALRGEPLLGSTCTLNDEDVAKSLPRVELEPEKISKNNIVPGGRMQGNEQGFAMLRRTLPGQFRKLQAQAIYLSAREAWKYSDGPVVFCISVDLRRHLPPDKVVTAFLSKNFFIEIKPEYTVDQIAELLNKKLDENREVTYSPLNRLLFFVPVGLINYFLNRMSRKMHSSGRYLASGIAVSMGLIPLEFFTGGGFNPSSAFAIPPLIDLMPFFIGLASLGKSIQVIITMPKGLASNGRIEAIMDSITSQLVPRKR